MALFTKNLRKHIFVHPAQQNKLHSAVKSALMKDKRKFSDRLEGALMDVSNLRVVGKHHLIVDGFLSMEVEADFQVFCPNVGMSLEGVVNKISRGHIGCLVMELFNTSIAIPPNSSVVLNIGDTCEFSVTDVIIDGDILSLRGSLSNSYFEQQNGEREDREADRETFGETATDTEKVELKHAFSTSGSLFDEGVLTQSDHSMKKSPKKSKKRSKKEQQCDEQEVTETPVRDNHGELDSGKKSKSPKKRKDKKHTIDLPDCVIAKEESLCKLKLESEPLEDRTPSPSKKSKKERKKDRLGS